MSAERREDPENQIDPLRLIAEIKAWLLMNGISMKDRPGTVDEAIATMLNGIEVNGRKINVEIMSWPNGFYSVDILGGGLDNEEFEQHSKGPSFSFYFDKEEPIAEFGTDVKTMSGEDRLYLEEIVAACQMANLTLLRANTFEALRAFGWENLVVNANIVLVTEDES